MVGLRGRRVLGRRRVCAVWVSSEVRASAQEMVVVVGERAREGERLGVPELATRPDTGGYYVSFLDSYSILPHRLSAPCLPRYIEQKPVAVES